MIEELKKFGIVLENVSLKTYNTYRIEVTCKYMLHPIDYEGLIGFLKYAQKTNLKYFVIGNGSNIILTDDYYNGVIVKLDQFKKITYNNNLVTVGSGVMINFLAYDIISHGLSGLEWASGIPGTIGGCIFGNAEAYRVSTFENLKTVTYLTKDLEIKTENKENLTHGYRTSYFKENPENIILEATFSFPTGSKEESIALIKNRLERRLATQPLEYPSAGSVFRNPSIDLPSGKLIDDLGLKGKRINDAMVSVKHANFIINLGNATGKDIKNLIQLVQDRVKEEYQIDLILEQEYKSW